MEFKHEPVLLNEAVDGLKVKQDGIYVDGTVGGGGHSFRIVQNLKEGRLIGIDQDDEALDEAARRLKIFGGRITLVKGNFVNIKEILKDLKIEKVDGILLDIGISSHQIDDPSRGFSYMKDGPLDMRMDPQAPVTAADIVNSYSKGELTRIIREYGEEEFAANIAKHIVYERENGRIETTGRLREIIEQSIPASVRKGNPAASGKTFQAIRIEVNSELDVLKNSLNEMIDILNPGGRLEVITFHSLEDRIVKTTFRKAENPCTCPPDFPVCVCGALPLGKVITRKPVIPSEEEKEKNRRAASAKLRIFEKK